MNKENINTDVLYLILKSVTDSDMIVIDNFNIIEDFIRVFYMKDYIHYKIHNISFEVYNYKIAVLRKEKIKKMLK